MCSYWLEGLCHSGEQCSFLHRLDKSKMPLCKNGKLCKKNNCPLKHVDDGEIEECLFYKQGFCYNGPKCGRRHIKRLPEECPDEVSFDPVGAGGNLMSSKKSKGNQPNDNYKVTLCTHWLLTNSCHFNEDCHFAHGELEINVGSQASPDFFRDADIYDPTAFAMTEQLELPFATTSRVSYFILQSPDLRSLSVAKRRGVWAVSNRIANDINDAYRTSDHVVFFFSVRPLRGIYGVAKLAGPIPVDPNFQSPMSPEFPIKWLRSIRLSLRSVAQLKLGMTGMFIGRCSTDGRFEKKVGLDMLLTTFHKPEWNWDLELERAERNIRLREADNGGILIGANMPEYYPVNGLAAYYLPPDVLFAPDWYERALIAPPEKGVSGGFARPRKSFEGGFSRNSFTPQGDFYSGEQPGFVFSATPPIIEEMLARFVMLYYYLLVNCL